MANYTLKDVDDELWKTIKKLAIDKDLTIQQLIIDLIIKALIIEEDKQEAE